MAHDDASGISEETEGTDMCHVAHEGACCTAAVDGNANRCPMAHDGASGTSEGMERTDICHKAHEGACCTAAQEGNAKRCSMAHDGAPGTSEETEFTDGSHMVHDGAFHTNSQCGKNGGVPHGWKAIIIVPCNGCGRWRSWVRWVGRDSEKGLWAASE